MRLAVDDARRRRSASPPLARGRADRRLPARASRPAGCVGRWRSAGRTRDGVDLVTTDVERAIGREWRVPAGGFWQVHPGRAGHARRTRWSTSPTSAPGRRVLDLYAGVGLFAGALAPLVAGRAGDRGRERRRRGRGGAQPTSRTARTSRWRRAGSTAGWRRTRPEADVVVLDPPRKGAGRAVVDGIAAAAPRRVVHVACDPSSLARDVALFAGARLPARRAAGVRPVSDDGARRVRRDCWWRTARPDGGAPGLARRGARDPGSEDWERTRLLWLFDQCPPDYRGYDVFRRHPVVLAHVARAAWRQRSKRPRPAMRTPARPARRRRSRRRSTRRSPRTSTSAIGSARRRRAPT